MGLFHKLFQALGFVRREIKVLVVGLDNSGKSTIINRLKPKKASTQEIMPTPGFQVERVSKGNVNLTVFDMSGAGRYRDLWAYYYKDAQAVIFVVDSADKLRICVAKNELLSMLRHQDMGHIPILFFANKMDVPGAYNFIQVAEALALDDITDRPWTIIGTNALTGQGLMEGVDWLTSHVAA
nr:Arl6 [Paratrimastix pyriformis]|eukprot:GAFH01005207.1.p2 GENE.GAFH01005207.1~~GAFH01005207.1.p2  ORF type:complete len:182 (+),score=21.29 GAFH01005207.1:25-570(+)